MNDAPETARQRANRAQRTASDPAVSAFVAASAGSGKTKLLTDRLLRLMLSGAPPERIQCLTCTKAAAAEMALRLQTTLGRWVTMPAAQLAEALARLEVEPTEDNCRTARALFARILDLPGGMRIGTIHAFSQSLLRRFPLEAAISPHFQLVDDRDADDALTEAREDMLANAGAPAMAMAVRVLAGLTRAADFGKLVKGLQTERVRLDRALRLGPDLERAQLRVLGVAVADEDVLMEQAVAWLGESGLREAARIVQAEGAPTAAARAGVMLDWLGLPSDRRRERWTEWCRCFLRATGEPFAESTLVNAALQKRRSGLVDRFLEEIDRIQTIEDARKAITPVAAADTLVNVVAQ